jgi:hypothetical protein
LGFTLLGLHGRKPGLKASPQGCDQKKFGVSEMSGYMSLRQDALHLRAGTAMRMIDSL